jgi:hypothetical protein
MKKLEMQVNESEQNSNRESKKLQREMERIEIDLLKYEKRI